jgi:DNA helicase-2/ATP-dependent DNA helicase PcrA
VVGMEEGILPHYRALNEPDEMEEERRLCYVALTRGKARVHVSGAQQRNVFGEPRFQKQSRFIKEMPNACCTFSGVQAVQGGGKSVSKWGESGAKVAPRAYPEIESVKVFAVGQAVLHAAWGQGVVSRVDGVGADAVIYVQFSGQLKKLLARYAPLVPVSATSTGE